MQANAFAQQTGRVLNEQAATAKAGFSLPKECDKASKILHSFLADPEHPDSALNSIPKAVLQQAKGLAVFSVIKAVSLVALELMAGRRLLISYRRFARALCGRERLGVVL